ncbi:MAG: hypothetical protein ACD_79C00461G0001, partial [uncultured bacterium]
NYTYSINRVMTMMRVFVQPLFNIKIYDYKIYLINYRITSNRKNPTTASSKLGSAEGL